MYALCVTLLGCFSLLHPFRLKQTPKFRCHLIPPRADFSHRILKRRFEVRQRFVKIAPEPFKIMLSLEKYLHECGLEESLLHLVKLRVSQINGCAFCLDMHWKDLRAIGESEQRLYSLDAWRECPYYTDRERSALAWAEALTLITQGHASDAAYEEARAHLNEKEISDLTFAIATINAWNRLAISGRKVPGEYQPAKTHEAVTA